jgi:hypothetical protein
LIFGKEKPSLRADEKIMACLNNGEKDIGLRAWFSLGR